MLSSFASATDSSPVILGAFGLVTLLVGAVVTPLFGLLKQQDKTHRALEKAMNQMAKSNKEIANETRQGNREAKERNGHLAELVIKTSENTVDALKAVKNQHVDKQVVDKQTVKDSK